MPLTGAVSTEASTPEAAAPQESAPLSEAETASMQALLDEMQRAIDAGYASDDPAVRAAWKDTPFQTAPTPEELLRFLAGKIGQASRSR